jgi:hypothetical protein
MKAFAAAAAKFINLISIRLHKNQIADDGLKAFATAAVGNLTNLKQIYLKSNQITGEGLKAFSVAGKFTNLQ